MVDRQVGGGHTETEGVGDVLDGLHDPVCIHVAVGATGHTVRCLDF